MEELAMRLTRLALVVVLLLLPPAARAEVVVQAYELPKGGGPHDVAVGADGIVWYTAQRSGQLGHLDPATGKVELIPLGAGAAPHGVLVGPDGAPWITEGGTNAIVRVDPGTRVVTRWPLPDGHGWANLNTLTFDTPGRVWVTGQNGIYGRPEPGAQPRAYAVYVDDTDVVWLSDWAANAVVRFDPERESFEVFPSDRPAANVRQLHGRRGEVWAPESGADRLVAYRTR